MHAHSLLYMWQIYDTHAYAYHAILLIIDLAPSIEDDGVSTINILVTYGALQVFTLYYIVFYCIVTNDLLSVVILRHTIYTCNYRVQHMSHLRRQAYDIYSKTLKHNDYMFSSVYTVIHKKNCCSTFVIITLENLDGFK